MIILVDKVDQLSRALRTETKNPGIFARAFVV